MLTVASIRRLIALGDSFDEQLTLVAWLVAIGRLEEAETERNRLERMANVPGDVTARASELLEGGSLAPDALRQLRFIAMRGGARPWEDVFAPGSLLRRLADAQRGLTTGTEVPGTYLSVADEATPELISLQAYAAAATAPGATETTLRNWVRVLEPLNAVAYAALAEHLAAAGDLTEARTWAGKALLLDGSNEAAWRIWSR
jgi:hypothetical protein